MTLVFEKNSDTTKTFFLIFGIVFVVFLFTSDGHRYTMDEDMGAQMALGMTTLEPHPDFVEGGTEQESKPFFHMGRIQNPYNAGLVCSNAITCFPTSVFYSVTEVPFIALNHYFHIITSDTHVFTTDDFADAHYVFWRNSENPDFIFLELFYSPFFLALSVGIFFLICLEHKFTRQNSIILSLLLALTTIIWAYSNTSLNVIPSVFFLLLGYLFFKKFRRLNQSKFLVLCSASCAFTFLIRTDMILFIIPMWFFILVNILKRNSKIYTLLFYSAPLLFSYYVHKLLSAQGGSLRYDTEVMVLQRQADMQNQGITQNFADKIVESGIQIPGGELAGLIFAHGPLHILTASYGMLFSPGIGLFIFSPILLTVFFSFPDFFRKNKSECLLFL